MTGVSWESGSEPGPTTMALPPARAPRRSSGSATSPTATSTLPARQRSPGVAERGADDVVGRLVQHGVGHDDHRVLGARQRLHPLVVGGAVAIDVLGHRLGAHEGDRRDVGVLEQPVRRPRRAVDDVEDARRGSPASVSRSASSWAVMGRALGGLEDVGVARADGDGQGPQRDHAREVEGRDRRHHAQREAVGDVVHAARRRCAPSRPSAAWACRRRSRPPRCRGAPRRRRRARPCRSPA